ncbi:MAG: dihydrodipicolinate synthase family protein [Bacillota bacterium]
MFQGVFAPIPTPFMDDAIDARALFQNLKRWEKTRLAGVVVLGSNGEFVLLTREEKEALIDLVRQHFTPDKKVIAGTGCESTKETISRTRRAAALGADAALVINPSYYKNARRRTRWWLTPHPSPCCCITCRQTPG